MSLTNKALLVSLNISVWTARKLSKSESEEVVRRHGAVDGAARVNIALLPGADSLRDIQLLAGTIRTDFYQLTLPWMNEMSIIKTDGYLGFTQVMARHKQKFDGTVSKFMAEYPSLREAAQSRLNGLYNHTDYPQPHKVAEKFKMEVAFFPVPDANDWRVQLSDTETEFLRKQIEDKVMESQGRAMREAWDRIHAVVSKARERLADPKNVFRDSLVENARELCRILPSLNIADDPHLERMRDEVERNLCDYDPDDLRKNEGVRLAVADKMKEIMDRMGPFMGAV
jgi:hypothetical protein